MTKETKEAVQYATAVGMLVAGMTLAFIAFYTEPEGEISDSVLWLLGQCLVYSGSVFGITNYVNYQIDKKLKGKEYENIDR